MDNQRDEYPRAELSDANNLLARDKHIEEIRQRWSVYKGESDAMWLLGELDRLQKELDEWKLDYALVDGNAMESINYARKLEIEVSQLSEEKDDLARRLERIERAGYV